PAFVITGSTEAATECLHKVCCCAGRRGVHVANDRHSRRLRVRRKRPCGSRAAEQRDEIASSHGHSLGARITPYHIVEKPSCASQHFGPPDFRNGSKAVSPL